MKRHSKSWILKHTLEIATIILAIATVWLAVETRSGLGNQLRVSTWLEMEKRFDSPEMKASRARLAAQLQPQHYDADKFDESLQDVWDLFDDMGRLYRQGLIDKGLTKSAFSYYVNTWWAAGKNRIAEDRIHDKDASEYEEFEWLAGEFHPADPNITTNDVADFLKVEAEIAGKGKPGK